MFFFGGGGNKVLRSLNESELPCQIDKNLIDPDSRIDIVFGSGTGSITIIKEPQTPQIV